MYITIYLCKYHVMSYTNLTKLLTRPLSQYAPIPCFPLHLATCTPRSDWLPTRCAVLLSQCLWRPRMLAIALPLNHCPEPVESLNSSWMRSRSASALVVADSISANSPLRRSIWARRSKMAAPAFSTPDSLSTISLFASSSSATISLYLISSRLRLILYVSRSCP